jgi:23S rRNA pseudouridine2457 synthase
MIPESPSPHRYFIIHKPYDMVSQFVSPHKVRLLGDLDYQFPAGTHAIGRLDNHSEGLLLLTTNKKVTKLLFSSGTPHRRVYLVQVNQIVSEESLEKLQKGVSIRVAENTFYATPPCEVKIIKEPEKLFPFIKNTEQFGPHTWLTIALYEGKYHQVRKMVGAVRHRCKRLIRLSIEDIQLGNLPPGEVQEIKEKDFFQQLKIGQF